MKLLQKILFTTLFITLFTSCDTDDIPTTPNCDPEINQLKINEIQIIASHNSYRLRTYQPIYDFVLALINLIPEEYNPVAWDYTHLPLEEQFSDYGVRGIELDIFHDPMGGHFDNRQGLILVNEPTSSGLPEMLEPGLKVIHIPDVDYMTNYPTFKQALLALKNWSDANPSHFPIFVNIEPKQTTLKDFLPNNDFTTAFPFTATALDTIDMEIKEIFGEDLENVLSPDEFRGEFSTLKEAALAKNWWTLEESRGKVIFILDGSSETYAENHPSLQGRVAFTYANNESDEAAFVMRNNSRAAEEEIKNLVEMGFIVRTRADSDTFEARDGDYTAWEAALRSGAHIISTDYYKPDGRADTTETWTDYHVKFENNAPAKINPISSPETDIECDLVD